MWITRNTLTKVKFGPDAAGSLCFLSLSSAFCCLLYFKYCLVLLEALPKDCVCLPGLSLSDLSWGFSGTEPSLQAMCCERLCCSERCGCEFSSKAQRLFQRGGCDSRCCFVSLGCWNLHNFNNLVKKEAIAFVLKLHNKLHVYQIYIFIKSSGSGIRVTREERSRCLSWERVWCALDLDLIWCFKLS